MGSPKTSETLAEGFLGSEVDKAETLDDECQKDASGASGSSGSSVMFVTLNGLVLDSEALVVEDGGRVFCNVETSTQIVEGGEGRMEAVEGETMVDCADSLVGNGDNLFSCGESKNDSLVDEAVAQSQLEVGSADDEGVKREILMPEEGLDGKGEVVRFKKTTEIGVTKEDDASLLKVADSAKSIDVFGDGISLYVEVCGPPTKQDHSFSLGDIIWVKTKVESWWPGKICDLVNVPNYGAECPHRGSLLVRYIGNGNFAWCNPSQLKAFSENFEEMSRQGKSRNFKVAVEKAVNEIGKCVKLGMTCACRSKGTAFELAGSGKTMGESSSTDYKTGKLSVIRFEPVNFLAQLKLLSLEASMPSTLEFTVAQSYLSAFYSSLGHSQLPMHLLEGTSDAKNSARDSLLRRSNLTDQIGCQNPQPAKDSLLCASLSSGNGSSHSVLLQKQSGVSKDEFLKRKENANLLNSCAEDMDVVMQNHISDVAEEVNTPSKLVVKSLEETPFKNSKSGNDDDAVEGLEGCKFTSPSNEESSKVSCLENGDGGGSEGKNEKGFELRERKKSKYLSPPYVNLSFGRKNSPVLGDVEELDMNRNAQESESPPIVNCCCKQKKKWSKKSNNNSVDQGVSTSSAELLSEVQSAALDCRHPSENTQFNSIERFFSSFRSSVFRDSYNCEVCSKHIIDRAEDSAAEPGFWETQPHEAQHSLAAGKPVPKRKRKAMASLVNLKGELSGCSGQDKRASNVEHLSTKLTAGIPGVDGSFGSSGSLEKDLKGLLHYPLPKVKSDQRMRKKKGQKNPVVSRSIITSSIFNFTSRSLINDSPGISLPAFNDIHEERMKKDGSTPNQLQTNLLSGIPDLNGNADIAGSVLEDTEFMGFVAPKYKLVPKKKKAMGNTALERQDGGVSADLPNMYKIDANPSAEGIPVQNNWEGQATATSLCPNANGIGAKSSSLLDVNWISATSNSLLDVNGISVKPSSLPVVNGICAKSSSLANDPPGMCFFSTVGMPDVKMRKRKQKATSGQPKTRDIGGIPDLNGNGNELWSLGPDTNCLSPDIKPGPRKRTKKGEAASPCPRKNPGIPDLSMNLYQAGTNGEAQGTALLLAFTPEFPMPTKEALIGTFCTFGPLIESETQVLKDSSSAQVVFTRSSDAGDAFRSLEKNKPFGTALGNYRLHNHSGASRSLEQDRNLHVPPPLPRSTEGLVIPTKPSSLNSQLGEAPSLFLIRQNLEMMTSMLEKSGNNLSPEMRTRLESEIKSLLKKVSTIAGSSSS